MKLVTDIQNVQLKAARMPIDKKESQMFSSASSDLQLPYRIRKRLGRNETEPLSSMIGIKYGRKDYSYCDFERVESESI